MAKKRNRAGHLGGEGLDLAAEFPAASDEMWQELVGRILAGRDFDETLVRKTYDGIAIQPLYTAKDGPPGDEAVGFPGMAPFTRGHRVIGRTASGWDVRQVHTHPDPSLCNRAILEDLERGATSIEIRFDRAGRMGRDSDDADASAEAGVGGVMIDGVDDLDAALEGVLLDACPIGLRAGAAFLPAAALLLGLVERRGVAPGAFAGSLNADPLGALAELGALNAPLRDALAQLALLARYIAGHFPAATAVAVDTTGYHDAGASEAQELACAVATGAAYLRAMTEGGLDTEGAFAQIAFTFATDANLFLSIAKLRAARKLWGRVAEACGVPCAVRGMRLHAVTSGRMLARRDPWVNILRGTVAALAAAVAGADSVTVLPFTAAIGQPDQAARRIARNTQLVLQQESSLSRVIDPAGGSWAIESLTEAMAREAWSLFQEIEREGGMAAALESGRVQDRIAAVAARRFRRIAELADPLTGTSAFPDLFEPQVAVQRMDLPKLRAEASARLRRRRERAPDTAGLATAADDTLIVRMIEHARGGASIGALARAAARPAPARAAPLPRRRLGEEFEKLRDLGDAHLEKTGKRPIVFLATIGTRPRYTAAETYARNFLAAGGIEATPTDCASDGPPIAAAFRASGATVAVICSDAAGYREKGAEVAGALAAAGARKVFLAGRPADAYGSAVNGFIYDGCDIVTVLRDMLQVMGVSEP